MVIFHSYVSLPEGIWEEQHVFFCQILPRQPINFSKLTKATEHLPASFAGTGIGLGMWTFIDYLDIFTHIYMYIYIYVYANNIYHKPSKTQFLDFSASTGDPTFDVSVPTRAHADQATDRETHRTRAPRSRSVGMTFMCWNGLHIFEMDTYIYIYMIYDISWYNDMILWILRGTLFLDKVRIWSYTHRHLVYTYIYIHT